MPDGTRVRLSLASCAVRRRNLRPELTASHALNELADLVEIEIAQPGFTDFRLTGGSAADWLAGLEQESFEICDDAYTWFEEHEDEIRQCVRRLPHHALGAASLKIPPFTLILGRRIRGLGLRRACARQWIATIQSLKAKGVRAEEIERTEIIERLETETADRMLEDSVVAGALSVPAVSPTLVAETEFEFRATSGWAVCEREIPHTQYRRRGLVGKRHQATHTVRYRHRSMGWLIALSEYSDLLTREPEWWTVLDHEGCVAAGQTFGFLDLQDAIRFAEAQIAERFHRWGRQHFRPRWGRYTLAGGEQYVECLVRLDRLPAIYLPQHFRLANVLIHIRCSLRETIDGKRVLFLDEVQSDWHADVERDRRAVRSGELKADLMTPDAPFRTDWPLLALKIMLWTAQQQQLDGMAWSSSEIQADRWGEDGPPLLLYQKLLPKAAGQIAAGLGIQLGTCALPVVTRRRAVIPVAIGWAVVDVGSGRRVAGPFRMQTTAQEEAARADADQSLEVPVLWLKGAPELECVPLWGVGQKSDWQVSG